jgi:hypothetical protein
MKILQKKSKKIESAKESLRKIQENIEPFVQEDEEVKVISTDGAWAESNNSLKLKHPAH